MRIDTTDVKAIFEFSPRTHILVYAIDSRLPNCTDGKGKKCMSWSLNPLIDRSYKGKDPDIAIEEIYISDKDAEHLKKAGFAYQERTECEVLPTQEKGE